MNTAALLTIARALHLDVLVDACTITREAVGTLNESTGDYAVTVTTVYAGACRVRPAGTSTVDAAGIAVDATRPTLDIPWTATFAVLPGDLVTASSGPLSGFAFEVFAEAVGTTSTCRRYTLEQQVTPGGVPT